MEDKEYEKRIESEARAAKPIKNEDLVCKDCTYRLNDTDIFKRGQEDDVGRLYGPTSLCIQFTDSKPDKVLLGGECEKYEREV